MNYLDGLRGWASMVVLLNHIFPNFLYQNSKFESINILLQHPSLEAKYGLNILQAFASTMYVFFTSGALAVQVFFVLSGYVLSVGFFSKTNTSVLDQARRRYLRLTIPILASVIITFVVMKMGMLRNQEFSEFLGNSWIALCFNFEPNLAHSISFALYDVYFRYDEHHTYNPAAWTMSIELAGSFLVFAVLLIFGRWRLRWGVYIVLTILTGCFLLPMLGFVIGLALADLNSSLLGLKRRSPDLPGFALFLLLCLILAAPMIQTKIDSKYLASIVEIAIATSIVILALADQRVQRALQMPASQFLGSISFPLYLIHLILLCSVVSAFGLVACSTLGRPGGLPLTAFFAVAVSLLGGWLLLPIERSAIKVSRLFSRAIISMYRIARMA